MTKSRQSALRGLERLAAGKGVGDILAGDPFASEIAHGAVRHLSRLDWIIEQAGRRPKSQIEAPVLNILRLGCYQLIFMPSVPAYAAVSESVETTKRRRPKAAGYVNWLLRRIGPEYRERPRRDEIAGGAEWLSVYYSFPDWISRRWVGRWGEQETGELMSSMNRFPELDLRVNLLKASRADAAAELAGEGGTAREGRYSPAALRVSGIRNVAGIAAFRAGRLYIQDESSQLPSLALAPAAGGRILDACCGVGGKAGHLAEIAADKGAVAALDVDRRRLALLGENMARLGHNSVSPLLGDILKGPPVPGRFDTILVDAPCSSLGIIRRHPEIKWSKRPGDPARLAGRQLAILAKTALLCRPGGLVAYSTCTTEPEENEGVVAAFLAGNADFAVLPITGDAIANLHELLTPEGYIATLPHRHGINGGFTALLQRKS